VVGQGPGVGMPPAALPGRGRTNRPRTVAVCLALAGLCTPALEAHAGQTDADKCHPAKFEDGVTNYP